MIASVFFQAMYNGYSGYQSIPDLLYSLITINMSLFAIAFYPSFDQSLSFDKYGRGDDAESKMPFKLTKMYVSVMKQVKNFLYDYAFLVVWGYSCACFLYFQWREFEKHGGILGIDGYTTDMESFGVYVVTITCIIAHADILRYVRHWDVIYLFWFLFSIIWTPFNLWKEESNPDSRVRGAIGLYMFYKVAFDLNMLFICALIMMPLILIRFRRTFWLEPELYCVE